MARLEELIPAGEEVAQLLDDINLRARQLGVRLNDFNPETTEAVGMYERVAYQVSFVGEYHDVGRLLADIASLPRIVRPVELDVERFANAARFPQYTAPVLATFRIETYVLPADAGAPAAASGGDAP